MKWPWAKQKEGPPFRGVRLGNLKCERPPPEATVDQVRDWALLVALFVARITVVRDTTYDVEPELRRLMADYNLRWVP